MRLIRAAVAIASIAARRARHGVRRDARRRPGSPLLSRAGPGLPAGGGVHAERHGGLHARRQPGRRAVPTDAVGTFQGNLRLPGLIMGQRPPHLRGHRPGRPRSHRAGEPAHHRDRRAGHAPRTARRTGGSRIRARGLQGRQHPVGTREAREAPRRRTGPRAHDQDRPLERPLLDGRTRASGCSGAARRPAATASSSTRSGATSRTAQIEYDELFVTDRHPGQRTLSANGPVPARRRTVIFTLSTGRRRHHSTPNTPPARMFLPAA